ncbi:sulfotransferase 1B1-like [Mercenaria mercenaria]|uniref:sulfotransferase 1B1-like n=1 Tax=Mercenaria mercenaria TaxID=6596 RepID=UPI001E1D94A2|nr:sulfotransferase 1B1-like [Mercenaria mercenaria]XP_045171747.1 sulfotransferase 1B1-like [Mercenaria mercenaria]XP_053376094.1 sulfotransferase 1B1-like [Mercenaria mercenaria]
MTAIQVKDIGGATIDFTDVGGFIASKFLKPPNETKQLFDNAPNFTFRDNDLMLCTYPKTGTNWMFDILMMTLNKSAEPIRQNKLMTMLENESPEDIDKQPSPRVINTHYAYRYLPLKDMRAKQIKTVLCCRNPKDTAVSYYNHMNGVKYYNYDGKWADWLPVYLEGKMEYGKYTDYLLEWEKAIKAGVGCPLHVVYYENLKLNCDKEMDRLLKFLGVEMEDGLKQQIMKMCGFESMAAKEIPKEITDIFFKKNFRIFRKGQVGDWKNWFSDEQNAMFDEMWEKEMKDSTMFDFIYTDPRPSQ